MLKQARLSDRSIPQPKFVPILGPRGGRERGEKTDERSQAHGNHHNPLEPRRHCFELQQYEMWITIASVIAMKTVQMTLDEELVGAVDRAVRELGTTRSAFARQALRRALKDLQISRQEERQRLGYKRKPVQSDEFADWENEQVWTG